MDATNIPLCLSALDWARFRQRKGALKIHMVLDYDGCLPTFMDLTKGSTHEVTVTRKIDFPKGSVLVFDRGYIDFEWLYKLTLNDVFFVTRAKDNMNYQVQSRNGIHSYDRLVKEGLDYFSTGLLFIINLPSCSAIGKNN